MRKLRFIFTSTVPRSKKCIFCGGYPLSKEHVLGKWLSPIVATPPKGKKVYIDSERMHYGSVERRARRFPKDIDIQVRCVCVSCNNGWMEAMESEVKPIIESLLGSGSHTLNQSEQFSLAKWAVKTAIIARYYAGKHEVPPMYRRWFYQNQVALPNSFVWVGTYDDELAATLESKDMALNALSFPHVQFVVFTVRRVLIAVLIAYVPSKLILEPSPLIREHLRIISPFGDDIIWPLNPLDKERRLAIFQSSWDDGLLFEVEPNVSPQSK